jgi:hypothetical protein
MLLVEYERLPAVGPDIEQCAAPLPQFLRDIPHLFYFGYMPPLPVVNAFLARGNADAGMGGGCRWKPFQISADDYAELVCDIRQDDGSPVQKFEDIPGHIRSENEWWAWIMFREIGIPYETHVALMNRESEGLRKSQEAAARQDHALAEHLHGKWYEIANEVKAFTDPYLKRYREARR